MFIPDKIYLVPAQGLKTNVTDLRLVGNAHPTVYQRFWRYDKAYFSAIRLKTDRLVF